MTKRPAALRLAQNNTALEWTNKCCVAPAAFCMRDSLLNVKYLICLWLLDSKRSSYTLGSIGSVVDGDSVTCKEGEVEGSACEFCLQNPCVTIPNDRRATFLSAHGPPRPQNISKRYRDYKEYFKILKEQRLWRNPLYINRKHELGIFVDDVREVMPNCVVGDVRKRWPNPPDIPYKGHVPTMTF